MLLVSNQTSFHTVALNNTWGELFNSIALHKGYFYFFKFLSDWDFSSDFNKMADKWEKAALRAKEWRLKKRATAEGRQRQQEYERAKYLKNKKDSYIISKTCTLKKQLN